MDINGISPYDVLDISSDSSIYEIKSRYRQLVLVYHPDKCNIVDHLYFDQIQQAYKMIMSLRREAMMPSDNIEYVIDDTLQQELDEELQEIINASRYNKKVEFDNFNKSEFNKKFNELNQEKINEIMNTNNEFNTRTYEIDYVPLHINQIDYVNPLVIKPPSCKDIGKYTGIISPAKETGSLFSLTTMNNFSTTTAGKNFIFGSDLEDVFNKCTIIDTQSNDSFEDVSRLYADMINCREEFNEKLTTELLLSIKTQFKSKAYNALKQTSPIN